MKEDKATLPVNMVKAGQFATVEDPLRPGGLQWVDMFLDSISRPDGPVQTSRFRMTTETFEQFLAMVLETKAKLRADDSAKPRH